jgi:hypothetical protein
VQIGQIRSGQGHPVHQLLHLAVAALLHLRDLALVAETGCALPQEQVKSRRVAPPKHLAQARLVAVVR